MTGCGSRSWAEDVSLDAALDLVPRLEDRRAGFDGPDTTFDLPRNCPLGDLAGREIDERESRTSNGP
jgi:hypothetical protein